jgi:hypothetical protein
METAIEFANKVRVELGHLTSEQIADLTDGLEADIASSLDDGADIGSAKKYATDLLTAAGMSKDIDVVPNAVDVFIKKVRRWYVSISDLEPAWWIFRAWVATQLIGWFLFRDQTSSPGYLEWRYMQWLGIVVLGVMLYVSVRIGRAKPTKWKTVLSISHVVLAVAGLAFMFVSPRGETETIRYLNPSPEQASCVVVETPNVVGMSVAEARQKLSMVLPNGFSFFDQDSMVGIASAPLESLVLQQNPDPGSHVFCGDHKLQLVVDLSVPMTTLPPQQTATTVLPTESDTTTTTTIPKKSATTTIPKATTTTSP